MSPVAANKRRATATPMIPPMKCAGMMISMLAVRPSRLSATRTGRFGASVGTSDAARAAALAWLREEEEEASEDSHLMLASRPLRRRPLLVPLP